MLFALCIAAAACAALPAGMTLLNLSQYRPPEPASSAEPLAQVAVVIPARDEEAGIAACLQGVLSQTGVLLEVVVIDDSSTDGTVAVVGALAALDPRLRLLNAPDLPAGWNGKQHACWVGAQCTAAPLLCFLDADVRLQPEALARTAASMRTEHAALISGFPRELTGTFLERLLIPLIHFILLGLLPLRKLRSTTVPGYAAGCGQCMLVERAPYLQSGGHAAIRHTMHDGLLLPRLLRQHGFRTTLVDLTDLAICRMYHSAASTWNGLAKNATEGMATPARIVPFTLLMLLGEVLPVPLLWLAWHHTGFIVPFLGPPIRIGMGPVWVAAVAAMLSYLPRLINTVRYRQSWLGALLHPVGVAMLLVLQWIALGRKLLGRPAAWKARNYSAN